MTWKYGKLLFLSALIFLLLASDLVGTAQEENKEKKKEPFRYFDTSTGAATYAEAKEKAAAKGKKKEPTKANETSTTTTQDTSFEMRADDDSPMPTVEVKYINGKPHGKALERHRNGVRIEGEYNNGLKTGLWITYDKTDKKIKQESYKDGKKDGKFTSWYDGYVYETDYKDGLLHGKKSCWDKNGKLIYEYGYKDGKAHGRHVAWYPNGDKSEEGYFNEGTGKKISWYLNKQIGLEVEFKNGKPYGKKIGWHENGQKSQEQTFNEDGKNIGKLTYWYDDGKVACEMEFDQNGQRLYKKDYDKDGNLIFENDRPVDKKKTTNTSSYVEIPPLYDLRNVDGVRKVTEVKNQLQTNWSGTCWAFGYMGALESHLMTASPQPSPEPDYSEQHLADKNHGWDKNGFTDGGNWSMTQAYLTRGGGPITETDMPYDPVHALGRQTSFPAKKWIREMQRRDNSVWWIPGYKDFCQDHIYTQNHGGVAATLYLDQEIFNGLSYYYCGPPLANNHTVVLVGWNEFYSRFDFNLSRGHYPYNDGALIVKNSWGKEDVWPKGDDGYFYISMDSDEFDPEIVFTDVADSMDNQYIYQYDLLGSVVSKNFDTTGKPNECTYANVFEAENPKNTVDNLKAVGFYLPWDEYGKCDYNYAITVYTESYRWK